MVGENVVLQQFTFYLDTNGLGRYANIENTKFE